MLVSKDRNACNKVAIRWADWNLVRNHVVCLPHSVHHVFTPALDLASPYSCPICHRGRLCGYVAMLS